MLKIYIAKIPTKIIKRKIPTSLLNEINQYKHPQARLQKNASYLLLNIVLNTHHIWNKDISVNEYGKPSLIGNQIYFNLSHSGEYIVCAVANNPIGVDIEFTNSHIKSISSAFLTKNEVQTYISLSNQKLTQIWAIKEAIVKLLGVGLSKKLSTISLASLKINNKRLYTFKKTFRAYHHLQFALASYVQLPKKINLIKVKL